MESNGTAPYQDGSDIIVIAQRWYEQPWWFRWGLTDLGPGFFSFPGISYTEETDTIIPPVANDTDSIDVDVNFTRPLTAVETAAVNHLKQSIAQDKAIINSLPENQQIRMYDGSIITKDELLSRYLRLDVRIDDDNYSHDGVHAGYANGTDRGESIYRADGDVEFHFEIHTLVGYHLADGMNYLLFHELGHTTPQGQAYNGGANQEVYANDVAWAMSNWSGSDRFEGFVGSGYSSTTPEFLNYALGPSTGGGPRNPGSHVPDPDQSPPPITWAVVFNDQATDALSVVDALLFMNSPVIMPESIAVIA